ncbi:MAG: DEAD/DEAH box helicase family protein [Clostridia bacterium]|nr:DEAD/DEAH box helicase family protein [Clostridia bacterium]
MQFTPHDYQKQSIDHMISHPRSILLLGMGFGKTVCTLSAIQQRRKAGQIQKTLVVAPLRVAQSVWAPEAQKWDHLQDLRFSLILGTEKQRRAALAQEADVYVVNRENVPWLVKKQEGSWPYDMVVVDELSSFRSPDSKRFKALASVVFQSPFFVGLTGTPMPT